METEGLLDYHDKGGDDFQGTVEPSPSHIRCRYTFFFPGRSLAEVKGKSQQRKSSLKSKFWGWMSGGRPRGYPGGRNFGQALEILENKHLGSTYMTRRRGRP